MEGSHPAAHTSPHGRRSRERLVDCCFGVLVALSRLPSRLVHAASMPTLATTVMELREAELLFKVAGALDDSDASSSDEETADMVRLAACEPLMQCASVNFTRKILQCKFTVNLP